MEGELWRLKLAIREEYVFLSLGYKKVGSLCFRPKFGMNDFFRRAAGIFTSLCRAGVRTECGESGGHVLPAASFVRAEGKHCFLLFSMVAQESAFRPAYAPKQLGEHIRRRSQRDTSTLTACMAGNIPSFFLFSQDRCRRCSRKGRGISTMSAFNLSCGGGAAPGYSPARNSTR